MTTATTPMLPSNTVADLAICVRDIFQAIDEVAPVRFGKRWLNIEDGPRRIVITPDPDRGKWSKDYALGGAGKGYVGSFGFGGILYVWGKPDADDFENSRDADNLLVLAINAMTRAGAGVIDGSDLRDSGAPDDVSYGCVYKVRFILSAGIPRSAPIYALKNLPTDPVSPPDPARPPGAPASTVETDITSTVT